MQSSINIRDYSYHLPEEKIAKYPLSARESSKLLVYRQGDINTRIFREITELIEDDMLLVFNDTRVVQARLKFKKPSGAKIEVFCLEPHDPADYNLAFQKKSESVWKCLVGNARKWKTGPVIMDLQTGSKQMRLKAEKTGREKDAFLIRFTGVNEGISFGEILEAAGKTPIPPYLDRESESSDRDTYQTVYSRTEGSVAAPTAGLHFTDALLNEISSRNIPMLNLTLHVGAGTFQPVSTEKLEEHPMHSEHFYINRSSLEALLKHKGRMLAVGTTSTRILESLFWLGARMGSDASQGHIQNHGTSPGNELILDQWEAYNIPETGRKQSLENLLEYMDKKDLESIDGKTRLMIVPGYTFRMVDRLLTNYHQPNSTLLLLVAAFIGGDWRRVYDYALNNDFRFLSYGDSSLLIP